jgi:hypothetical protein
VQENETIAPTGHNRAARVTAWTLAVLMVAATVPLLVVLATGNPVHRTHETSFILFAWLLVAGSLVTVATRPTAAAGALRVVLAAGVANLIVAILTPRFDPIGILLVAFAVILERIGRFGMWSETWHIRRWEAALPVLLVAGLGSYVWDQIGLQAAGPATDEHIEFGHYALMATIVLAIALAALIGSSEVDGNHIVGTLAGSAAVLIGLGSLLTSQVSAFGLAAELALILGGLVFVGMVQLERMGLHPQSPPPPGGTP